MKHLGTRLAIVAALVIAPTLAAILALAANNVLTEPPMPRVIVQVDEVPPDCAVPGTFTYEDQRQQYIDDMVSHSVKVGYRGGHGTGVLFVRGEDVYCITAAHVVVDRYTEGNFENLIFPDPFRGVPRAPLAGRTYGTGIIWISRHTQSETRWHQAIYTAELIAADGPTDIAILKVKHATVENFPGLHGAKFDLRNNKSLKPGMKTIHVGQFHDSYNAVTDGVICNPQHPLLYGEPPLPKFRVIQVTNMSAPGSSGGGVYLEQNGRHIGLLVRVSYFPGDAIVIPIYEVYKWAQSLDKPLGHLFEDPVQAE